MCEFSNCVAHSIFSRVPKLSSTCTTRGQCRRTCTIVVRRHRPLVALIHARRGDDAVAHALVRRHHPLIALTCAATGRCRRTFTSATASSPRRTSTCTTRGRCRRTCASATASSPLRTSACTTTGRCRRTCTVVVRRHRSLVADRSQCK